MSAILPSLLSAALYATLVVMIGALGIHWLVLPHSGLQTTERAPSERMTAGAAMAAAGLLLLVVPARVGVQMLDFLEPGEPWRPALNAILFTTQSGKAAQLQMVWATATLLAFSVARSGRPRGWRAATIAVIVLAMTPGLGGHPSTEARPVLAMTVATVHVLAAGLWVGSLFHLWRVSARLSPVTTSALIAAFHRVAQGAVALLALTGLYAALTMLTGPGDLVRTPWGGLLAGKLALVAVALAMGAWHWRTAEARLARGEHPEVMRSIGAELLVAFAVIAATGFLSGTAPPV